MTQMNQHQALANLHKVVQICNSGLNMKSVKENALSRRKMSVNEQGAAMLNSDSSFAKR